MAINIQILSNRKKHVFFCRMPAKKEILQDLRVEIKDFLVDSLNESKLNDFLAGIHEAASNAVLHGSRGGEVDTEIEVEIKFLNNPKRKIETTVRDFQKGDSVRDEEYGQGFVMMKALFDNVKLDKKEQCTECTLLFDIE